MFPFEADDGHRSHVVHMRMTVYCQSGDSPGSLPPFPEEPAGFTIPTPPTAPTGFPQGGEKSSWPPP